MSYICWGTILLISRIMKIAISQCNFTVGDFRNNKQKIIDGIRSAKAKEAELVVFSEYAISGTPCYDLLNSPNFLAACEETLKDIARHCDGISVLVGLPIQVRNDVMSVAAFVQDKCIVRYIGKKNVDSRTEKTFINNSKGTEFIVVGEHRIAVVVGDDLQVERTFGDYADIIVNLASARFARGRIEQRYGFCQSLSFTMGKPLIFANHMGGQSDFVYDGSSFALDCSGRPIAIMKSFEEDFAVFDTQGATPLEIPVQNRTRNAYRAIKLGLSDYFAKNGFKKACLGMSGGIDSAVVLAMAAEVLGPENIKILMLPSQFSSGHSVTDSVEMAERLGVEYEIISIEPAYNAVTESLESILGNTEFNIAEENIQSRLRCVMLMALSNKHGHILLNTSNKSEAAVGYGTLYGDCTGAIGIIGDLYKIEVYELARYINRNEEIIPQNIILKEPSAELHPDQKDSDSLPPYEVMDAILFRGIEEGQSVDEIIDAGFDDKTVRRILEMVRLAEYKRRQSAPPLRLSMRPFSSHFVLPMLSKFTF